MSAPYCKELEAKHLLDECSIKSFIPMCYKISTKRGKKNREWVPAIRNLIFVYATRPHIQETKNRISILKYLTRMENGKNVPIIVPDMQMRQFISVCESRNEQLIYLKPEEIDLKRGTPVRILGGPLDGVKGIFIKVKGVRNRRVVVHIQGIAAVAAAEIQPDMLEILSEPEQDQA